MSKGYRLAAGVNWLSDKNGDSMSSNETRGAMVRCERVELLPCRCCGHAKEDHTRASLPNGSHIADLCTFMVRHYTGRPTEPAWVCGCAEYRPAWEMYERSTEEELRDALRLAGDALARHEQWCGFNSDAPGDMIVHNAEAAIREALAR